MTIDLVDLVPRSGDPIDLLKRLDRKLTKDRKQLQRYDAYYEGEQPLRYMAPALMNDLGERLTQLVINWPRLGAEAYENRLDIEGFRYKGDAEADDVLWDVWQSNNGDEQAQQAHLESLVLGRSYAIVGAGDDEGDPPVISVEHPFQVVAIRDPRTRLVSAALKRWQEDDRSQWAVLYLPESTTTYTRVNREWTQVGPRDDHELGRVPVVPLVNRPRMLRPDGLSEFHDVIPIADAANKMATDMMVSGEYHAMPRRWVFGMKEEDFVDEQGRPLSTWSSIAGNLWASENTDVKVGQFPEADLAVFHNTIRQLAQVASQLLALPPHYMSFSTDNPASADAIRSSETQLVKRVERKHTFLGGAWEDVNRLVLRIMTGAWDEQARAMETLWRDPSTPTVAQTADAVVKLTQVGILPLEYGRERLGYTPEERRRMAEMDTTAQADPTLERIARELGGGLDDGSPVNG